jgi:hypothetical protein
MYGFGNARETIFHVGFDGSGGEAENAIAPCFQVLLPYHVLFLSAFVDCSIYFDDESLPRGEEINHETSDHDLSPELDAVEAPVPQLPPQQLLRPRRRRPKLPRSRNQLPRHVLAFFLYPPPLHRRTNLLLAPT